LRIATSDTSAPNPADFTERRQPVLRRGFTVRATRWKDARVAAERRA